MAVITFPARIAFVNALFEPKPFQGDPASKADFNSAFLVSPDWKAGEFYHGSPSGADIIKLIENTEVEVAKTKWRDKADAVLASLRVNGRMALRDGNTKPDLDGYPGTFFINARSKVRPLVIDRNPNHILTASDGVIYSGCYVNAQLEIWPQDNGFGKRLNAQLKGVQFIKDGDAFAGGGTPAKQQDFADLSVLADDSASDLV